MPTGYTEKIFNGEVRTPKDFLHLCLRNFGILYFLGDKPLKVEDDYSEQILKSTQSNIDYNKKLLESAQSKLNEIQDMDEDSLYRMYLDEMTKEKETCENMIRTISDNNAKLMEFKEKIQNWKCSQDYESVKRFALEQLDISKESTNYYDRILENMGDLFKESFLEKKDKYVADLTDSIKKDIARYKQNIEDESCEQARRITYYHFFKQELNKLDK